MSPEDVENTRVSRRGRWKFFLAILLILIVAGVVFAQWRGADLVGGFQNARMSTEEAATTARVKAAFMLSSRISAFDIDVDTTGDVVTLAGRVSSDEVRALAEGIARDVASGADVRNEIEVIAGLRPDSEIDALRARIEDLETKTSVLSAISNHPRLETADVNVAVAGGEVTLSGSVADPEDKLGMERIALATAGVQSVANDIAVNREEPERAVAEQSRDDRLMRRVEFALYATDAFDLEPIEIRVGDEEEITLAGFVSSRAEALLAERVARDVVGVGEVTNALEVVASSDAAIVE